jgi:hypothetical protein
MMKATVSFSMNQQSRVGYNPARPQQAKDVKCWEDGREETITGPINAWEGVVWDEFGIEGWMLEEVQ